MPFLVIIYLVVFLMMLIFNIIYLSKTRSSIVIIFYDIFEGAFLAFMVASYWVNLLKEHLVLWVIPAYIFIVSIDIYISVWGDVRKLGIKLPEDMDDKDIETANLISLLFASPAYFISGLVCLEYITSRY